jgi:phage antirepressor YoqD-like protein
MTKETLIPVRHEEVAVCGEYILAAVTEDGKAYFSPRHVCDALGIAWPRQFTKIKDDAVLSRTVTEMITVAADGKKRVQTMLPIEFANGWLFTIKKVRPELQAKLNLFRAEAFLALDAWFRQGLRKDTEVQTKFKIPQSLAEALEFAAEQVRKSERLAAANKVLAPKAAVYEKAFADRCITIARFARTLRGVNSMKVKEDLMNAGYLYRRHSGAPYKVRSQYREKLFAEKVYGERGYVEIIVLDKGKQKIVELYRAGKLTMKRGYENAYKGAA